LGVAGEEDEEAEASDSDDFTAAQEKQFKKANRA